MTTIARQRCLNHAEREAVARCPQCGRFFCRECVVEHDDRVLCTACLTRGKNKSAKPKDRFELVLLAGQAIVATVLIWFLFFLIGRSLVAIPSSFHDGTIWQTEIAP